MEEAQRAYQTIGRIETPFPEAPTAYSPRSVDITFVTNGWIVTVGCKTFVFQHLDIKTLMKEIEKYLTKPEDTVEEYRKRYNF